MNNDLLRPSDIAAMMNLTTGRIYQLAQSGVLPHVKIGRSIRIPRIALEEWLQELSDQASSSRRVLLAKKNN